MSLLRTTAAAISRVHQLKRLCTTMLPKNEILTGSIPDKRLSKLVPSHVTVRSLSDVAGVDQNLHDKKRMEQESNAAEEESSKKQPVGAGDESNVVGNVSSEDKNKNKASFEEYLKEMNKAFSIHRAVERLIGGYFWNVPDDHECRGLASLIMKIQGPFCIKGKARPRKKEITINIDGEPVGTLFNLDVNKIVSKAKVAPFGRGSETIVDPSVRNALEITADRLSTTIDMNDIIRNSFSYNPAMKLCFDFVFNPLDWFYYSHQLAPRNLFLKAELYKMHIYPEGGKFEPHVDTSHGKGHHATLVAILPTEYEGGELVVEHGGKEAVIGGAEDEEESEDDAEDEKTDTAGGASKKKKEKTIKMGCFYTDCIHRVLPVTSGTRIALQWDLFLTEKYDKNDFQASRRFFSKDEEVIEEVPGELASRIADDPAFVDSFVAAADKLAQKHEKKNIAIPLRHRYPTHSLATSMLRGGDQGLYDVLKRVCSARGTTEPVLVPIIISYEEYYSNHCPMSVGVSPFDSAILDEKFSSTDFGKISQEEAICVFGSLGDELDELYHREYIDYTGNEAQPESGSYMSAALVIRCK